MIQKTVNKHDLDDPTAAERDLAYWLSRPSVERLAAVDLLRKQVRGSTARLRRVARVVEQTRSTGRKKDLADLESLLGED